MRSIRPADLAVIFGLLLACIAIGRSAPGQTVGDVPGSLPGLIAPVRIVWDDDQVPHVVARNDHDVYFAMGYLHAKDRLFQMDYNRRLFSGTLAELVGESALDSDIQLRTLGLRRAAERSWAAYSPEARDLFDAYSDGINAYLQSAGFQPPSEYATLELTAVAPWTSLDSVTVANGIAFGLSFDLIDLQLTQDHDAYVEAGNARGFDGDALFRQDLDRSAPFDPTVTIPSPQPVAGESRFREAVGSSSAPKLSSELVRRYLEKVRHVPLLRPALERSSHRGGSNFWIVGPAHSATGHALFANDPHLSLSTPSVFYEIHLSASDDPASGPLNVAGVSFPGTPGVIQGCNDRICWGSTVNPMDVTDVYQEKLAFRFEGLFQVVVEGTVFDGQVEPIVKIPQTFRVNRVGNQIDDDLEQASVGSLEGGVTYVVPRRNDGPIVQVLQNPDNPLDLKGLSVQFAGWGATREGETFLRLARARNLGEFKEALQYFDFGSQNWGYADVDGNIAYFTSGELPIREDLQAGAVDGSPPWFVRDGTHQAHNEWLPVQHAQPLQSLGFEILPFGEMPQVVNPPQGFIISANNDPVGVSLDNDVLNQFRPDGGIFYLNPGFTSLRIGRIHQMMRERLDAQPAGLTLEDLRDMQADNELLDAQVFVPSIRSALDRAGAATAWDELAQWGQDPEVVAAVDRLDHWDFSTPTGVPEGFDPGDDPRDLPSPSQPEIEASTAATVYAVWRSRFVANTIDATLRRVGLEGHSPDSERSMAALRHFLDAFDSDRGIGQSGLNFFEVEGSPNAVDARDVLILRSLREALDALRSDDFQAAFEHSGDPNDYRWGRLHRIRFAHPLGGDFSLPPAGGFASLAADLQGLARSGGYETVDASSHSVRASGSNGFMFSSGPARRFVADLDPSGIRAHQVIPGGRSEDRSDVSYASEMGLWLTNGYHPLRLSPTELEGHEQEEAWLALPAQHLYLPLLEGDGDTFTGFAAADSGESTTELELRAWSEDGQIAAFPDNPHRQELAAGGQWARVASEIFGLGPFESLSGWIELEAQPDAAPSDWTIPTALMQVGDPHLEALDGASAIVVPARRIYFTLLDPEAENRLIVVNPGDESAVVRMELVLDTPGETGASTPIAALERTIPPHGMLQDSAQSLFSIPLGGAGYVRASTDQSSGLVGVEKISRLEPRSLLVLNAQPAGGPAISYSAQLAVGEGLESLLCLVNAAEFDRVLVLRVVPGNGDPELASEPMTLHPGEFRRIALSQLFGASSPNALLVGSLVVDADGRGVIGCMVFEDSAGGRFRSVAPLQRTPFRSATFGQVANLGEFFTGLALFNPEPADAAVRIRVFDALGMLQGDAIHVLPGHGRLSELLSTLVPSLGQMAGGYIVIDSDRRTVGQEIFGTFDLRLQSAVSPTLLK